MWKTGLGARLRGARLQPDRLEDAADGINASTSRTNLRRKEPVVWVPNRYTAVPGEMTVRGGVTTCVCPPPLEMTSTVAATTARPPNNSHSLSPNWAECTPAG